MKIKKCIEILQEGARTRLKKYPGDAADYAFRVHTLKLLSEIAKKEIKEADPDTNMPSGKDIFFSCKACNGDGYVSFWETDKVGKEYLEIQDCKTCKGEGALHLDVVDKRKISKDKLLEYDSKY